MLDSVPSSASRESHHANAGAAEIFVCSDLYNVLCDMDESDIDESKMIKMYSKLLSDYEDISHSDLSDKYDIGKVNEWSRNAKTFIYYINRLNKEIIKESKEEAVIVDEIIEEPIDTILNDISLLPGWPFVTPRLSKPRMSTVKKVMAMGAVGLFLYGITSEDV